MGDENSKEKQPEADVDSGVECNPTAGVHGY